MAYPRHCNLLKGYSNGLGLLSSPPASINYGGEERRRIDEKEERSFMSRALNQWKADGIKSHIAITRNLLNTPVNYFSFQCFATKQTVSHDVCLSLPGYNSHPNMSSPPNKCENRLPPPPKPPKPPKKPANGLRVGETEWQHSWHES